MNSIASLYFLYLYPVWLYHSLMILQLSNFKQSAQVSRFMSLKQHTFILHFALLISLSPVSKPILHPLQYFSRYTLQVLQYAPQHPMYRFGFIYIKYELGGVALIFRKTQKS